MASGIEEHPNTDIITLTRYVCIHHSATSDLTSSRHVLNDQFRLGAQASGDLTLLLTAIQTTCKFIATNVRKARLINLCVHHFARVTTRSDPCIHSTV
jgi:hypothetical protein